MATQVLAGNIATGIRHLQQADFLSLYYDDNGFKTRCYLIVIERGDPRELRISEEVFETLAAWGIPYGD